MGVLECEWHQRAVLSEEASVACVHQSLASCRLPPGQKREGITSQAFPVTWLLSAEGHSLAKGEGMSHWQPTLTQLGEVVHLPRKGDWDGDPMNLPGRSSYS